MIMLDIAYPPKGDHNDVRPSHYIVARHSVSMDQLDITVPGIKLQLTRHLTNIPIVGAQVFADHSSSPPSLHSHLLENLTL